MECSKNLLEEVTRERDYLKEELIRVPAKLNSECVWAMKELQSLRKRNDDTIKRCNMYSKEYDTMAEMYRQCKQKLDQYAMDIQQYKSSKMTAMSDNESLQSQIKDLKNQQLEDKKEIEELRKQQRDVLSESGSSEVLNKLCSSTFDKYDVLKSELDDFKARYNELSLAHNNATAKLTIISEENQNYKMQLDKSLEEKTLLLNETRRIQQQCNVYFSNWQKMNNDKNRLEKQNLKIKSEIDSLKVDQKKESELKYSKLRSERDAIFREYSLIMSERDAVHQEIEMLNNKLLDLEKQKVQFELERNNYIDENANLGLQKEAALKEQELALKQCMEMKQKLDNSINMINCIDQDHVSTIEMLRMDVEKFKKELEESHQENRLVYKQRDHALKEKNKIVLERESIKTLCGRLRKDRDRAVSELADALRNVDEIKLEKAGVSKEYNDLKKMFSSLSQTNRKSNRLENHESKVIVSKDSAIGTDSSEFMDCNKSGLISPFLTAEYSSNESSYSPENIFTDNEQNIDLKISSEISLSTPSYTDINSLSPDIENRNFSSSDLHKFDHNNLSNELSSHEELELENCYSNRIDRISRYSGGTWPRCYSHIPTTEVNNNIDCVNNDRNMQMSNSFKNYDSSSSSRARDHSSAHFNLINYSSNFNMQTPSKSLLMDEYIQNKFNDLHISTLNEHSIYQATSWDNSHLENERFPLPSITHRRSDFDFNDIDNSAEFSDHSVNNDFCQLLCKSPKNKVMDNHNSLLFSPNSLYSMNDAREIADSNEVVTCRSPHLSHYYNSLAEGDNDGNYGSWPYSSPSSYGSLSSSNKIDHYSPSPSPTQSSLIDQSSTSNEEIQKLIAASHSYLKASIIHEHNLTVPTCSSSDCMSFTLPVSQTTQCFQTPITVLSETRSKPLDGETRIVRLERMQKPLGIKLDQGINGGVFVSSVSRDSIAAYAGVQVGDQLLEVCGINLRNASYAIAVKVFQECGDSITMMVQYRPYEFINGINLTSSSGSNQSNYNSSNSLSTVPENITVPENMTVPENNPIHTHTGSDASKHTHMSSDVSTITPDSPKRSPTHSFRTAKNYSSNSLYEARKVVLEKKNVHDAFGINLVGGNISGIFVQSVHSETVGNDPRGLRVGDQILEINGKSLVETTLEDVMEELTKPFKNMTLWVQYNSAKYTQIAERPGDGFYIKVLLNRESTNCEELELKKHNILYVDNTMHNGEFGAWRAWTLDENGHKLTHGIIPNRIRLEQEMSQKQNLGDVKEVDPYKNVLSTRRSFFRKIKHRRSQSKESKDFNKQSNSSVNSDSSYHAIDDINRMPFIHVERNDCNLPRPVIIISPLSKYLITKLCSESPDKYHDYDIELNISGNCSDMNDKLETIASAAGNFSNDERHLMLDVNPDLIQKLWDYKVYPIVIFIHHKSVKQIREVKDTRFMDEPLTFKECKLQYDLMLSYEDKYQHLINCCVEGGNLAYMAIQVKTQIENYQKRPIWISKESF